VISVRSVCSLGLSYTSEVTKVSVPINITIIIYLPLVYRIAFALPGVILIYVKGDIADIPMGLTGLGFGNHTVK
jgi:hypothetical protein